MFLKHLEKNKRRVFSSHLFLRQIKSLCRENDASSGDLSGESRVARMLSAEWKDCFKIIPAFGFSWFIRLWAVLCQHPPNSLRKDQLTQLPLYELNICGGIIS